MGADANLTTSRFQFASLIDGVVRVFSFSHLFYNRAFKRKITVIFISNATTRTHTYTDTHIYTVLSTKRIHGLMPMLTYGELGGSWRLIKSAVTRDHGAVDVTKAQLTPRVTTEQLLSSG